MKDRKLYKQLIDSGSTPSEAEALASLASSIHKSAPAGLSKSAKSDIATEIGIKRIIQIPKFVFAGAGAFAVVAVVFIASSALPGSLLYPVKRGSEKVREAVQPGYSDQLIEVRREELDQLVEEEAPVQKIEKAEKEYNKALEGTNKKPDNNTLKQQAPEREQNRRQRRSDSQRESLRTNQFDWNSNWDDSNDSERRSWR